MRRALACTVIAAAGVSPLSAAAAESPPAQEKPPSEPEAHVVDFEADQLDVDGDLQELVLHGNVVVRVERYRLTSDRLRLERGPRGIVVDGSGRVAFCHCPNPPVSLGFEGALVAPPTDLLLEQPTVRVGNVPVFWMPYLWLRAPDRLGMLPPKIAWRGDDGLLAGTGVHVPLSGSAATLDVTAAAYFLGGVEVQTVLLTEETSTDVRWDHLEEGLLAIDARGSAATARHDAVSWSVDALRGDRALRGPVLLEDAAKRTDRAELSAMSTGPGIVAVGVRADAPRGGPMDRLGRVGPRGHLGYGGALGSVGAFDTYVRAHTFHDSDAGSLTWVTHDGEVRLDGRPGPATWSGELRSRAGATMTAADDGQGLRAGGRTELALPLVREYGAPDDPFQHWIVPFVDGNAGALASRGPELLPMPGGDGAFFAASGGARTVLGRYGERSSISARVRGGWVGSSDLTPATGWRVAGHGRGYALQSDGAWLPDADRTVIVMAKARVGELDALNLGAHVAGAPSASPLAFRWLDGGWDSPYFPWLDRVGWTFGSRVGVPWTDWLATAAEAEYDHTNRTLLGVRGSTGYRHPCGCLAIVAWAGHRVGRDGVDAWVTADLAP